MLISSQRPLFGAQGPLGLIFGIGIFFGIPKSFTSGQRGAGEYNIVAKLAKIDYLGAALLVGFPSHPHRKTAHCSDCHNHLLPLRPFIPKSAVDSYHCLRTAPSPIRLHRAQSSVRANHSGHSAEVEGCASLMHCSTRHHDGSMDGSLLHTCLCHCRSRLVSSFRRLNSYPNESWICPWRCACRLVAYQACRKLLVVGLLVSPSHSQKLISVQSLGRHLLSVFMHIPRTLSNLKSNNPCTAISPVRLHQRVLHRLSTELHAGAPAASHTTIDSFHLRQPSHHLSGLRRKFWFSNRRWSLHPCTQI